ncbi:phospholipase A2-like protein Y52B11A.8 [Ditylenchus destructor]|nr:phospholipase A2-like protein Y52B11A.8 [Ditylenchus destructor]
MLIKSEHFLFVFLFIFLGVAALSSENKIKRRMIRRLDIKIRAKLTSSRSLTKSSNGRGFVRKTKHLKPNCKGKDAGRKPGCPKIRKTKRERMREHKYQHQRNKFMLGDVPKFYQSHFMPLPPNHEWSCGNDDITHSISLATVSTCPMKDALNSCCYNHDNCYEIYKRYPHMLHHCDTQLGTCIRYFYRDYPFCSMLAYVTHVDTLRLFGEKYKRTYG